MHKWFRFQLTVLLVSILAFTTYAFASSDLNESSRGGEGTGMISGRNISAVHYHLSENASNISAVEFDLDGSATQVVISFDMDADRSFSCYNVSGYHWMCEIDDVEIARANYLRVITVS